VPNPMPRCPKRDWNVLNPGDPYSIRPVCPPFSLKTRWVGKPAI